MAKHRAIRPFEFSEPVRRGITLAFFFGLILSLLAVFITDGARAYAEASHGIPHKSVDECTQTVILPSAILIKYDNSERPRANTYTARIVSTPTCAIVGQYMIVNENNEVMSTFQVKGFTQRARFTLYPGSGTHFFAVPDTRTYSTTPSAVILGSPMPLVTDVSNEMVGFHVRIGAKP